MTYSILLRHAVIKKMKNLKKNEEFVTVSYQHFM